ncbi:hypothetical protein A9Y57_00455 [Streptococcus parauberis]|uniref:DUF3800 domain-containing protein n=1 Tax=Streptococcus parauberis TaxID=1348 RepID=A0A854WAL7_9STRE|nr:DUF3800 domain-containing protein [Streptococcus parauberis]PCH13821.1 hypothetical protein A9Y57_00455 [Streptococcus parauberis]
MYIYIDESGSINNSLRTDFIITLIATDNKESLKRSYKRFVSSNLEKIKEADKRFVSSNLKKIKEADKRGHMFLNGKFKELKGSAFDPDLKKDFMIHFSKKNNLKIFYIHIHNSRLTDDFCSNTARVFNYTLRKALEYLIKNNLLPSEEHNLIIDERNIRTGTTYFLSEYLKLELTLSGINNGKIFINYVDSATSCLVQIADVFSNIKYSMVVSNNRYYRDEFDLLKKNGIFGFTFNFPIQ